MQNPEIEVFTLDAARINKWLLIAANHYGFKTVEAGLISKKANDILRFSETIQQVVHESERQLLERINPTPKSFWSRYFGWLNQDF